MNLDTLPDDELLLVLGFLGRRELLQCRGVCRRLRDVALHPDLWRKRGLWTLTDGVELCGAVLRLAPCLGTFSMFVGSSKKYLQLGSLLATTNCAISKLSMTFTSEFVCLLLAMLLARQATLGRLTSVSVLVENVNPAEFQLVLDQLLHTQGLTSVEVRSSWNSGQVPVGLALPKAAKSDAVPASLRTLEYRIYDDSRLLSYLQTHADTLQVVYLDRCKAPAGTATLLGSLPRLRELRCDMMENMPALLQCPSLKTLHLSVRANDSTRKFLPGVQQYLRQAVTDRLEDLTLEYEDEMDVVQTVHFVGAVNLVLSLAGPGSSAPSALQFLKLCYKDYNEAEQPQPQLQPLAAVLHRLENLVTLDLGGPPTADFLAALDGRVLPRLQLLRVYLKDDTWGGGCPHKWAHGPEPRDLLRKYPRLHLKVVAMHENGSGCADCDYVGCYECECDFCERNSCHDVTAYDFTLSCHPEQEACNQQHEVVDYIRIHL